jgi:O-antigen ligase
VAFTVAVLVRQYPKQTFYSIIISAWLFIIIYEIKFLTSYFAAWMVDHYLNYNLLFPHFGNVRFFNQFQIWLIPFSLAPLLFFKNLRTKHKIFVYAVSSLWITILFATQSRGALLAVITSLIVILIIYQRNSWQLIKSMLISSGLAVGLYLVLFNLVPKIIAFISDTRTTNISEIVIRQGSFQDRIDLWHRAIDFTVEAPFFGIGPMHFAYYPNPNAHPHNSLLQITAEFGVPFTIILSLLLAFFAFKWIKFARAGFIINDDNGITPDRSFLYKAGIVTFWSFISGITYSMVSGVLVMPLPQTMLFVCLGLLLGILPRPPQRGPSKGWQPYLIQIVAGTILIGLAYTVTPHLSNRILTPFFGTYLPTHTRGPRYWELGGLVQKPSTLTPFSYSDPRLEH